MDITLIGGSVVNIVSNTPQRCRACGAVMYWALTKNNKRAPIVKTENGWVNHFSNCPEASRFKKTK